MTEEKKESGDDGRKKETGDDNKKGVGNDEERKGEEKKVKKRKEKGTYGEKFYEQGRKAGFCV